jgi:hypothetical protein
VLWQASPAPIQRRKQSRSWAKRRRGSARQLADKGKEDVVAFRRPKVQMQEE